MLRINGSDRNFSSSFWEFLGIHKIYSFYGHRFEKKISFTFLSIVRQFSQFCNIFCLSFLKIVWFNFVFPFEWFPLNVRKISIACTLDNLQQYACYLLSIWFDVRTIGFMWIKVCIGRSVWSSEKANHQTGNHQSTNELV